ncbi:MAG: xanthine dehydrogenase family protein molybdopterin-binding subunit, partial [Polyangiaceae bacterium]
MSYGQLLGGKLFNVAMPSSYNLQNASARVDFGLAPGVAPAKPVSQYTLVGTSAPRIEIQAIVTGTYTYVQNIVLPGMQHGRVVRPLGQAVYGFGAPIISVDASSVAHIPGVQIVQKKNFLGVVAPQEYNAIQAAAQLKVQWADPPPVLPGHANEFEWMRAMDAAGKAVQSPVSWYQQNSNRGNVGAGLASAAKVVSETYAWASNVHNPLGPNCCVADVTPQGARIYASSQTAYGSRTAVATALGISPNLVRVSNPATGGSFGTPTDDDANVSAALLSQAVGKPVRMQFMRWDEIGWEYTSPASMMDIQAGIDKSGNMIAFNANHFYPQYISGPVTSAELAQTSPLSNPSSSITGNFFSSRMYSVVDQNNPATSNGYLVKSIPNQGNWIRAAFMRAGSAPGILFAGEQMVDELAHAAQMDPVAFRLQNVTHSPAENRDL